MTEDRPHKDDSYLVDALSALLCQRRSVRAYRPTPIPQSRLEEIFAAAGRAPSNCNVQPWTLHVVSGEAAARLREKLFAAASADLERRPDFPLTNRYPGVYRRRQIGAAKALFEATGVGRDDMAGRRASMLRNFRFFDAPHAAFLYIPDWAGMREAADCGMYAQSLMLSLAANGIGSCAQGALSHYADIIRRELGVDAEQKLLFGLAFGYEESGHPASLVRTDRAALTETTHFHR